MTRERLSAVERLKGVRRRPVLIAATCLLFLGFAAPAYSQDQPIQLEATVGLDGWVPSRGAIVVKILIEGDVLVSGSMLVTYSGSTTEVTVDVPAGGQKVYNVPVRSAIRNGAVTVLLEDEDGNRLATDTVRPMVAMDEVIVGTDEDGLVPTLTAVQTAIDTQPVVAVPIDAETDRRALDALGYAVTASPSEAVWSWVDSGGRLVTTPQAMEASPLPLEPVGTLHATSLPWYTTGGGEILVADDFTGVDWSKSLRPVPIDLVPTDQWGTVENSLVQAATNSGDAGLADLPWLPFALVAYLLAVGPINLWTLKRMARLDWAWITIPVISLVALTGFWLGGRQRLDSTALRHASLVVVGQDGYQQSMVVVAAGSSDRYEVSLPQATDYVVADVSSAFGEITGSIPGSVSADGVAWDLPKLGLGAALVSLPADPAIDIEFISAGGRVEVAATNRTDVEVEHWGAVVGGAISVADGPIPVGETRTVAVGAGASDPGMSFGDVVVDRRQLWDQRGYEVISPLGWAASSEVGSGPGFVFAIATATTVDTAVNGAPTPIDGPTVWVVPVDETAMDGGAGGRAGGTIIGLGDWRTVDTGGGTGWIDSDNITLSFDIPLGSSELEFEASNNGFGRPANDVGVWNWSTAQFHMISLGDNVPTGDFISEIGEVVVRVMSRPDSGEPLFSNSVWVDYGADA